MSDVGHGGMLPTSYEDTASWDRSIIRLIRTRVHSTLSCVRINLSGEFATSTIRAKHILRDIRCNQAELPR